MRHGHKVHSTGWLRQSVCNLSYFGEYRYSKVVIHSMLCVLAQITNGRMQWPQRNWTPPPLSILRLTCLPRLTWRAESFNEMLSFPDYVHFGLYTNYHTQLVTWLSQMCSADSSCL